MVATPAESCSDGFCAMGVDTGRDLHVVILQDNGNPAAEPRHLIHLAACHNFGELDALMERFRVGSCVIDGLPETHVTREFAKRHRGPVFMNFFNEAQRGSPKWDEEGSILQVNRTEVLDASRAAIRDRKVVLPRRSPLVEEFARHMAADAKILDEDDETGTQKYRYVRTGTNHFSMAFTYACLAASNPTRRRGMRAEDLLVPEEPSIWDRFDW